MIIQMDIPTAESMFEKGHHGRNADKPRPNYPTVKSYKPIDIYNLRTQPG